MNYDTRFHTQEGKKRSIKQIKQHNIVTIKNKTIWKETIYIKNFLSFLLTKNIFTRNSMFF